MNVIAAGGPSITHILDERRWYTGDSVIPLVRLAYANGQEVHNAEVKLSITRPEQAAGSILSNSGLRPPLEINGDILPPKSSTLIALEEKQKTPLFTYTEEWVDLRQDRELTGVFEHVGPWGCRFKGALVPGNYTFRAVAKYGDECRGMRETFWTKHVHVTIDADSTRVTTVAVGEGPDGRKRIRVTVVPQDRFGNLVGPGNSEDFAVAGVPGSEVISPLTDNRDGSYSVDVLHDPGSGHDAAVSISQPDRPCVCITLGPDRRGEDGTSGRFWLRLIVALLILVIVVLLVLLTR